jgi:hypothetical protein
LVQKAATTALSAIEDKQLQDLISVNQYMLAQDQTYLDSIPGIVENNPKTISNIMVNLSKNYQNLMTQSLKMFLDHVEMTINSLEVVFYMLQTTELPQEFLDCYIYRWFHYCKTLNHDAKIQRRKLKLISSFLTHLVEKKMFDASACYDVWMEFCTAFDHFKSVKDLQKLLTENSAGNKDAPVVEENAGKKKL